jgi:hypothetical protein
MKRKFGDAMQCLPLNFPQDFLPERRLLSQLLPFAGAGGHGDKVQIGAQTGIPTGASTGKVEPMIHYSRGMGLLQAERSAGCWQLALTELGKMVAATDPYLSQPVTLWLLHLMLCRRHGLGIPATGIADAWFALFAEGGLRLGNCFTRAAYLDCLTERHGAKGYLRGLSGLVPRCYREPGCLGPIGALVVDEGVTGSATYVRRPAPLERAYFPAFSVYFYTVWDDLYPDDAQLAADEFFAESRALAVLGWDRATASRWLDWMTDHGLIQIDRQTGRALLLRLLDTRQVITGIYDGLI